MTEVASAGASEPPAAREGAPGTDRLARRVFALLLLACLAAFFVTQRLKHTPTAVQDFKLTPYFSPTPSGHHKQEGISFKLSHAERVTVEVIDSSGNVVATLLREQAAPRYKLVSLRWNGRRGVVSRIVTRHTPSGRPVLVPVIHGRRAPGGEYRVRVKREHGRAVLSSRSFTLVRP